MGCSIVSRTLQLHRCETQAKDSSALEYNLPSTGCNSEVETTRVVTQKLQCLHNVVFKHPPATCLTPVSAVLAVMIRPRQDPFLFDLLLQNATNIGEMSITGKCFLCRPFSLQYNLLCALATAILAPNQFCGQDRLTK